MGLRSDRDSSDCRHSRLADAEYSNECDELLSTFETACFCFQPYASMEFKNDVSVHGVESAENHVVFTMRKKAQVLNGTPTTNTAPKVASLGSWHCPSAYRAVLVECLGDPS